MKCYTVRNMEIRNFRGEGRVFNFLLWSVICIYLKRITSRGETRKITKSARLLGGQASNLKNDCILHFPLASSRYVHRVHAPPPNNHASTHTLYCCHHLCDRGHRSSVFLASSILGAAAGLHVLAQVWLCLGLCSCVQVNWVPTLGWLEARALSFLSLPAHCREE